MLWFLLTYEASIIQTIKKWRNLNKENTILPLNYIHPRALYFLKETIY